jgi:hypothetical protein
LLLGTLACVAALSASPANAQLFGSDPNAGLTDWDESVFLFGGRFHSAWVWDTALPWSVPYEDNYFLGAGYQIFYAHPGGGLHYGLEFGAGARISNSAYPSSFETWFGFVARHDGIAIGDTFRISPAITGGFSVVSAPIGVEAERAAAVGRDVHLLFYMGPEISITYVPMPNLEAFFRIHHRSGMYGVLAPIDGSNAATFGMRYKF